LTAADEERAAAQKEIVVGKGLDDLLGLKAA
jgi:hypothetical protein